LSDGKTIRRGAIPLVVLVFALAGGATDRAATQRADASLVPRPSLVRQAMRPGETVRITAELADVDVGVAESSVLEAELERSEASGTSLVPIGRLGGCVSGSDPPRCGIDLSVVTEVVNGRPPPAPARLRVRVPVSVAIDAIDVQQGAVIIRGLRGGVSAHVIRGRIDTENLSGRVRLEVGTGAIVARAVRLTAHSLKCRTFNGDVRVELTEAPADARILALTLNGAVVSALPLTTRAAFGPRFAEATFGAGRDVLSIDAVRGDIRIDVLRSAVR
jgi:hypothetical protein